MERKDLIKLNVLFEEAEEGGFTVSVPGLPGCISEGDTYEEAINNIIEAIQAYTESMQKDEKLVLSNHGESFLKKIEIKL